MESIHPSLYKKNGPITSKQWSSDSLAPKTPWMISPQKKSQNPGTSKDRPGPKTPLGAGAQAPRGARVLILKCTPTYSANFQAPRGARKPPDECGRMHTTSMPVLIYIITLLSSLILMQCGDINPNPGPRTPKYPCGMCKRAVTRSCKAIMCDNCNIWIHNIAVPA